jgi:hypothetical protein
MDLLAHEKGGLRRDLADQLGGREGTRVGRIEVFEFGHGLLVGGASRCGSLDVA